MHIRPSCLGSFPDWTQIRHRKSGRRPEHWWMTSVSGYEINRKRRKNGRENDSQFERILSIILLWFLYARISMSTCCILSSFSFHWKPQYWFHSCTGWIQKIRAINLHADEEQNGSFSFMWHSILFNLYSILPAPCMVKQTFHYFDKARRILRKWSGSINWRFKLVSLVAGNNTLPGHQQLPRPFSNWLPIIFCYT